MPSMRQLWRHTDLETETYIGHTIALQAPKLGCEGLGTKFEKRVCPTAHERWHSAETCVKLLPKMMSKLPCMMVSAGPKIFLRIVGRRMLVP